MVFASKSQTQKNAEPMKTTFKRKCIDHDSFGPKLQYSKKLLFSFSKTDWFSFFSSAIFLEKKPSILGRAQADRPEVPRAVRRLPHDVLVVVVAVEPYGEAAGVGALRHESKCACSLLY